MSCVVKSKYYIKSIDATWIPKYQDIHLNKVSKSDTVYFNGINYCYTTIEQALGEIMYQGDVIPFFDHTNVALLCVRPRRYATQPMTIGISTNNISSPIRLNMYSSLVLDKKIRLSAEKVNELLGHINYYPNMVNRLSKLYE